MNDKGKLLVLEGTDGSGKTVQFNMLTKRLRKEGVDFQVMDFPLYEKDSSYFVKRYLNGEYGKLEDIDPHTAASCYAMDRFDVSLELKKWLSSGTHVISNRYIGSNMGHQGARFDSVEQRQKFLEWLEEIEYEYNKIPKPDLNIILHVPAEIAQKLGDKKSAERRKYAKGKKRDIHEANLEHLKKAERAYLELSINRPEEFVVVECVEKGEMLSPELIHKHIWKLVEPLIVLQK